MLQASFNIWAVLLAVVFKQALGFLWFSPMLFGRAYQEAIGLTGAEMKPRMMKAIGGDVASGVVVIPGTQPCNVGATIRDRDGWGRHRGHFRGRIGDALDRTGCDIRLGVVRHETGTDYVLARFVYLTAKHSFAVGLNGGP